MQTHLFGEDTASKSYLYSQNFTSFIFAILFLKEKSIVHTERRGNSTSKTLSNLKQSINCTQFFLWRVFTYLGRWKQLPKTWLNLENDSIFEDKSYWVHSSATILLRHNRSHKANILWSELNTMLTDSAIPVKYGFMHK